MNVGNWHIDMGPYENITVLLHGGGADGKQSLYFELSPANALALGCELSVVAAEAGATELDNAEENTDGT